MAVNTMQERDGGEQGGPAQGLAHGVVIYLVSLLLTLPLFLVIYPHVPAMVLPIGDGLRVDHIVTFLAVLVAMVVLVRKFQLAVYLLLVLGLGALTITSLTGRYGLRDVERDYGIMLNSLRGNTRSMPLTMAELRPFQDADVILSRIDYQDPLVRRFAVKAATTWFADKVTNDDYELVQDFSVFKVINGSWRYVNDVRGGEYFAPASESISLLAGDCDDHAILMAACLKAIGAEVRLVRTTGHIYPELKVGDAKAMERAAYLIREELFPEEAAHAPFYYHTDANGDRWINLDYTRHYPGGEVMDESIKGILPV